MFGASGQAQNTEGSTAVYYSYDPVNRLKSVTSDDGLTASYTYDAKGRRVVKTVNGVATNHVWDGNYIVRERNGSGTEISRYYRAGNKLVANKSNNATNYYYSDPHGNVVSIGNNENIYTYDAFGNQTSNIANDTNPFKYSGEYFDNETGFVYLRNRYYDSSIGRFITEDPAKDGMNWYVYCSNNPVMFVDPSGMIPTVKEAAMISQHIYWDIPLKDDNNPEYNKKQRTVEGWRLINFYEGRQSLKMGVYIPEGDDWQNPSEYVVAFKGTDDWFSDQALNNIEAKVSNNSANVWDAMNYSLAFVQMFGKKEITFVGHSKGGGEAIAAADYTDKNAITFNAANYKFDKYVSGKGKGTIDNYYVEGEILESTIGTATIGNTHWLPRKYFSNIKWYDSLKEVGEKWWNAAVGNHDIKTVIEVL